MRKDQQVGGNMLMFHVDFNMKRLGIRLKKRLVSMIQSQLFLLRDNNFIHGALSDLKLCRMFSFTKSCVTHCMKGNFQKIHNKGRLCINQIKVNYFYSTFYNTDCIKAALEIKQENSKINYDFCTFSSGRVFYSHSEDVYPSTWSRGWSVQSAHAWDEEDVEMSWLLAELFSLMHNGSARIRELPGCHRTPVC